MSKFKRLEDYLEEIDHYLVVEKGGEEILSESLLGKPFPVTALPGKWRKSTWRDIN